ncbi:hypothetical protein Efla_006674 [Eimeria flavescens]
MTPQPLPLLQACTRAEQQQQRPVLVQLLQLLLLAACALCLCSEEAVVDPKAHAKAARKPVGQETGPQPSAGQQQVPPLSSSSSEEATAEQPLSPQSPSASLREEGHAPAQQVSAAATKKEATAAAAAASSDAASKAAAAAAEEGEDEATWPPRDSLLSSLKPLKFRSLQKQAMQQRQQQQQQQWQQQQEQQRQLFQQQQQLRRLRSALSVGLVGSRMRRNLRWRRAHPQQQEQVDSSSWVGAAEGGGIGFPGVEYVGDFETEDELSEKCLTAFRGDAITHKTDPIGRAGPRSLRLLACQLEFPRDGGRQRDTGSSLTLQGVALPAPPANVYREHRLSSGALVLLASCPACPHSAVSFYIRRAAGGVDSPAAAAAAGEDNPGCGAAFAVAELGTTYKALGMVKPWLRQAVVCSGSSTHFAAISRPMDMPRMVEAMASQLSTPLLSETEVEKAFIAAASSFNAYLLSGQPRAVAMHLALKCGVGEMAKLHFGTWRTLRGWAERQGLSVQAAISRYHEQAYLQGRLAVAIVDRRPMADLEAVVGPSLSLLASRIADATPAAAGSAAAAAAAAAGSGLPRAAGRGACTTPALHYLECMADQQHPRVFFSFFLSPPESESFPLAAAAGGSAAAAAAAARSRELSLSISLRARRLLVAMLTATGRSCLMGRLIATGVALHANVHLPISNDSGALLQIELVLSHANFKERLADAGEMIFAFIAALSESPLGPWFVAEEETLAAFDKIFSLPRDPLQAVIDLVAADAAHDSDSGLVENGDLKAAAAAAVSLLLQLSPSRLHLVLQSPSVDSKCSRIQAHTLARYGDGKIEAAVSSRWQAAFRSRRQSLMSLINKWGLSLPSSNPFATWALQQQAPLSLRWQVEEQGEKGAAASAVVSSSSSSSTSRSPYVPSPSPRSLTEAPLKALEVLTIPRSKPSNLATRRKTKLTLSVASPNEQGRPSKEGLGSRSPPEGGLLLSGPPTYKRLSFPPSHPCHRRCVVRYRRSGLPDDPRAAVSVRLNSWTGEQLVSREEAAAEVFLTLVRAQMQAVIEEASRAGVAAATSAGSFAAETHESSVRRSDTVVISLAGPWEALEGVLLALLLPLSPSPAAALAAAPAATAAAAQGAAGAAAEPISHAAVAAANTRLATLLQEVPRPGLLLTESALDLLVDPQKTREGLSRELRRARVDEQLVASWRDSLWKRMALQATIEGNMPESAAFSLVSLVMSTLKPDELVSVSEAVPSRVVDLRGLRLLAPFSSSYWRPLGDGQHRQQQAAPPTALFVHPAFSATAFHAVRVYVQLGCLGSAPADSAAAAAAAATAAAAAAAGDWFATAVSLRLRKENSEVSAARPPYFLTIGGVAYLSGTVTSSLPFRALLPLVNSAVRSLAALSVEEALREIELLPEWSPRRRDRHLCPFTAACPELVHRLEQPLLEWGIELSLRALRETPRLLLGVRGSLVSKRGNLGYGFGGEGEPGDMDGFIPIRDPEGFKEIMLRNGFAFNAEPIF